MTEEFRQQWLEAMQEYSKALEVEDDSIEVISDPADIDETISMPGAKLDADGRRGGVHQAARWRLERGGTHGHRAGTWVNPCKVFRVI